MYPYTAACTHLLMMLPEWAQAGGYRASLSRLSRPDESLRLETAARVAERGVITLSSVEDGASLEGRILGQLADSRVAATSTSSSSFWPATPAGPSPSITGRRTSTAKG